MKTGKNNKLLDLDVSFYSAEDEAPGMDASKILDTDSLNVMQVMAGTNTIILTLSESITAEAICLFNVDFETDVVISVIDTTGPTTLASSTINISECTGYTRKTALFELPAGTAAFDQISIITNGSTIDYTTFFGYIWAGDLLDFTCLEALQISDNDTSSVTMSRTNVPSAQDRYKFQAFQLTTRKDMTLTALQEIIRTIQTLGFGTPRPFILDEPVFPTPLLLYGILDSGTTKYDTFFMPRESDKTYRAQTTIGIREVS